MSAKELFFLAQKAFIVHEGSVLLVRKSLDDPNQPGLWEVPGGRMKFGENPDKQIKREVLEEVGLDVEPGRPFFIWDWRLSRVDSSGEPVDMHIVAVARLCSPLTLELSDSKRVEDDFLGEIRWVKFGNLTEFEMIPNMEPVIRAFGDIVTPK